MRQRAVRSLRKTAIKISCLALAVFGLPSLAIRGQQPSATEAASEKLPSFEVASIKPSKSDNPNHDWHTAADRVAIGNYSLKELIVSAYGLKSTSQVLGGPEWLDKKHFDIEAKVDDIEVARLKAMSHDDRRREWNLMLQSLIADRFALKVSHGERTVPVYILAVAKSGAKLRPASNENRHDLSVYNTDMTATGVSTDALANYLTQMHETEDRVVVNRTGLSGDYDFKLEWTRDRGDGIPPDAPYPGLFTALREQLGLELKPDKAPIQVIVVESANKPTSD